MAISMQIAILSKFYAEITTKYTTMNTTKTLLLTFGLLPLISCMSEPLQEKEAIETTSEKPSVSMKSMTKASSQIDSVAVKDKIQSDYDFILMNHIVRSDSGLYILCLAKEEAIEIGIPSELYDNYSSFVESLNPTNK